MSILGELIREKRQELGMTLEQLSKKTYVSSTNIGNIERGRQFGSNYILKTICDILQIEDWYKLYESPDKVNFKSKTLLGKMIRDARLSQGLYQSDIADRVYITRSYLTRIEAGDNHGSYEVIKAICEILKIEDWKDSYGGFIHEDK